MEQTDHEMRTLVKSAANGDAESCNKLYEHLVDKVFAFTRYRTATHEEAIDLTQDVFIDFFSTLSNFTYQSSAQLYAYVFVITRRKLAKLYDVRAKYKVNESVVFDEATMSPTPLTQPVVLHDTITQALATLEEVPREIVVLHHWSRYTFGEIALLLNMTESAVRVAHHRALKRLQPYLEEIDT